ncbi:hypothetical protein FB451DRAFT_1395902 [Mycena latifolia]|nr:hypothetical protein FB451DRAFT_1395902 [Mycena latifolia]
MLLSAGHALCPPSAFRTLARSAGRIETPYDVRIRTNTEYIPHILLLTSPWHRWQPGASFLFHCPQAFKCSRRTVLATAPDEQPSTVLDAVSTATMCWAAAVAVRTAGTGMRCYREPWAHRSFSAPVTARITPLHRDGAATRHFIEMGMTHTGRFMSESIYQSPH